MQNAALPTPKAWEDRAGTCGILRGGLEQQVQILEKFLGQLPAPKEATLVVVSQVGEEIELPCNESCMRQLSPLGLVARTDDGGWTTSEAAARWLLQPSDLEYLAGVIHANIRFFGEILVCVGENTTHDDLLITARHEYNLGWAKLDPVRRRVGWLRSLGFLELWGHRLVVTDAGRELAAKLSLASSADTVPTGSSETEGGVLPAPSPIVADATAKLTDPDLVSRKEAIGYIPRGLKRSGAARSGETWTAVEGLRKSVSVVQDGITVEDFREAARDELGVNAGSFTGMLHALRHMGFVELVAYNKYGATDVALACLEPGREIDLARYFHTRFAFFGELLAACGEWKTTSQLLGVARSRYAFGGDNEDIRTRIAILTDAGLLQRYSKTRVQVSPLGRDLMEELALQSPSDSSASTDAVIDDSPDSGNTDSDRSEVEDLIGRIRKCAVTGSLNAELEVAVTEAFEQIGFSAKHVGGSGDTDGLAIAELPEIDRYSVIFEAKATSASTVPESQVNFEAIKRHRRKNNSAYVALVGVKFSKSTVESAVANDVAVITTEDLTSLLERHQVTPLSVSELRAAFEPSHSNLEGVDPAFERLDGALSLAASIVNILRNESIENDPEDRGFVSVDNLRWALRSVDVRATRDEIRESLALLMHPVISAVKQGSDSRYGLADSPNVIARRVHALGDRVAIQSQGEG